MSNSPPLKKLKVSDLDAVPETHPTVPSVIHTGSFRPPPPSPSFSHLPSSDRSYASEYTVLHGKDDPMTLFFGRNHRIPTKHYGNYIEFRYILQPEFIEDSDTFRNKMIAMIDENPLKSVVYSSGFESHKYRKRIFATSALAHKESYQINREKAVKMTAELQQLSVTTHHYKEVMENAIREYELHKGASDDKRRELEDTEEATKMDYQKMHKFNTLYTIVVHREEGEHWSKSDAASVREKLGLLQAADVLKLTKRECLSVLHVLESMKWEENPFFRGLWTLPPATYTRDEWIDLSGKTPKIKLAHAPLKEYQIRICDYIGLPTHGFRYDDDESIPEEATLEMLQRLQEKEIARQERELEERKAKTKKKFEKAMAQAALLEAEKKYNELPDSD